MTIDFNPFPKMERTNDLLTQEFWRVALQKEALYNRLSKFNKTNFFLKNNQALPIGIFTD